MKQDRNHEKVLGGAEVARGVPNFKDCSERRYENKKLCYSSEETAEALGIGIQAVYRLLKQGLIPSIRVGQKYLIPVSALEEALTDLIGKELA